MEKPLWSDIIPQREAEIYAKAGFGQTFGYGKKPAILIVDVEYGFVGVDPGDDIFQAIEKFPKSCGKEAWKAVEEIKKLIERGRRYRVPILYVHSKRKKDGRAGPLGLFGDEIVESIQPRPEDLVLEKEGYSAFFGTPLASHLIGLGIDTIIVTGCTTSGCIRASVIDACSFKFKVIIPVECVFDRAAIPHKVNLFDMNAKYGDVVRLDELSVYLERVSPRADIVKPE
ncbi:MAG: isochorismatase family protein [Thermodesulfobacteriota bacterium]